MIFAVRASWQPGATTSFFSSKSLRIFCPLVMGISLLNKYKYLSGLFLYHMLFHVRKNFFGVVLCQNAHGVEDVVLVEPDVRR